MFGAWERRPVYGRRACGARLARGKCETKAPTSLVRGGRFVRLPVARRVTYAPGGLSGGHLKMSPMESTASSDQ